VGRFTVSCRIDAHEILLGESVTLYFRVMGEGNLNYLQPPPLEFEDILITGQDASSELEAFDSGYRGWIEWSFRLSPQKAGNFSLKIPAFFWFDPESRSVGASGGITLPALVRERQSGDISPAAKKRILRSWDVEACEPWDVYEKPYLYAFILPCVFFFARGILKQRKKSAASALGVLLLSVCFSCAALAASRKEGLARVDRGAAAYDSEDYGEAERFFREALAALPESPGVYYNLGEVRAELADAEGSVFWFRKAVFRNPSAAFLRERLGEMEKSQGIAHAAPVPEIHPDVFFAVCAACVCALAVLPWLVKKRTILFVCCVVLLVVSVFSAGGIAWQASSRSRDWGVVTDGGASLRKIPLPEAAEWIRLAAGTALDIESRSGDFALVSTGSGIRGWIGEETLRFAGEAENGGQ
jgi:tetratricopeptide (TPR) repeat protein